jgi:hypothetical protein
MSIKRNNNTLPHTGEMASWQMRAILVPRDGSLVKEAMEQEKSVSRRSDTTALAQPVDPSE